jgi:hypothetical protein
MSESLPIAPITSPLPADVRADGAHGRRLYEAALGFEQQLVQSLASQLTQTTDQTDDSSDADAADDGTDTSSTTDAASGLIGDQLPDALASGVTSAGGLGLADELYRAMRRQGG